MLFQAWESDLPRTTRDLDLLGVGDTSEASVLNAVHEIWRIDESKDGLELDPESLVVESVREQTDYVGLRLRFRVRLGNAVIPLQIDVGVGDDVVPAAEEIDYPTLLDFPAPQIWAYPKTTVVAEKTQVMIELGLLNSRLKDYFDVSYLARTYPFDGRELREAIEATLRRRGTVVPQGHIDALESEFAHDADKQTQWDAFLRRAGLPGEELSAVVEEVRAFVRPVLVAMAARDALTRSGPRAVRGSAESATNGARTALASQELPVRECQWQKGRRVGQLLELSPFSQQIQVLPVGPGPVSASPADLFEDAGSGQGANGLGSGWFGGVADLDHRFHSDERMLG